MANPLAITAAPQTPPTPPRGVQWIDVAMAAKRAGCSERNITRRCGEEWFPLGLARTERPEGGRGKPRWVVREDTDKSLARVRFAQQAIAMRRAEALRLWHAALYLGKAAGRREPAVTAAVLPRLAGPGVPRCGRSTLFTWRRWHRTDGMAGLADLRGVARARWQRFGPFLLDVERVYTARLVGIEVTHELVSRTAAHMGWPVPTLRDTQRYVQRYILPGLTAERGGTFDGGSSRASNDI